MKKTEIVLMKKILKSKFKMYKITKKKKNHWEYDVWQGGNSMGGAWRCDRNCNVGIESQNTFCPLLAFPWLFVVQSFGDFQ